MNHGLVFLFSRHGNKAEEPETEPFNPQEEDFPQICNAGTAVSHSLQ